MPSDGEVSAAIEFDAAMNYALAHNAISPLRHVRIDNATSSALDALHLEITLSAPVEGRVAAPLRAAPPTVGAHSTLELPGRGVRWMFDAGAFAQLDEAVTGTVGVRLFD